MKKVVSDRRASLDEETEIKPAMRKLVEDEFRRGASIPVVPFPRDGAEIPDTPRLTLVVADPEAEWSGAGSLRTQLADWTRTRGKSPRLYPGALVWCLKKPGRDLRDKVELGLAWKRVAREVAEAPSAESSTAMIGPIFSRRSRTRKRPPRTKSGVTIASRFSQTAQEADGLKVIDLGAGHSSSGETLCGRVIAALKSEALLNESVGAGYIERNWPPALKDSGAWPLASLRQSFLNGSLTRLVDPDATLKAKIAEFVMRGDFGLASGKKDDGTYERMWFQEMVAPDEVVFDPDVFLLRKATAETRRAGKPPEPPTTQTPEPPSVATPAREPESPPYPEPGPSDTTRTLRIVGTVPPEVWNRLGTKVLPKLRSGSDLKIGIDFSVAVPGDAAANLGAELRQSLQELGLAETVKVE